MKKATLNNKIILANLFKIEHCGFFKSVSELFLIAHQIRVQDAMLCKLKS